MTDRSHLNLKVRSLPCLQVFFSCQLKAGVHNNNMFNYQYHNWLFGFILTLSLLLPVIKIKLINNDNDDNIKPFKSILLLQIKIKFMYKNNCSFIHFLRLNGIAKIKMLRFWAKIAKISNRRKYPLYGMWRHRCAGGLKKKLKLYLRSGSQRHRHVAGFFNVPDTDTGPTFLYGDSDTLPL